MGLVYTKKSKENDGKSISFPLCPSNKEADDAIAELMNTPKENRNVEWEKKFLSNVSDAELAIDTQENYKDEKGHDYIVIKRPTDYDIYRKFVIRDELPKILGKGMGLAVMSNNEKEPIFLFSYGDLIRFYILETFIPTDDERWNFNFEKISEYELSAIDPPEEVLPGIQRIVLKRALENKGYKNTKCYMLIQKRDGKEYFSLAFNAIKEKEEEYIDTINWHIPNEIAFTLIFEDAKMPKL